MTDPNPKRPHARLLAALPGLLLATLAQAQGAAGVDQEAARALAKKSDCFKCHTVDQKKDGPAYREVAKKWRGKFVKAIGEKKTLRFYQIESKLDQAIQGEVLQAIPLAR